MASSFHPPAGVDPPATRLERLTPLFLLLAAVGVFLNSVPNGFAYDDVYIVQTNPLIRDLRNIPDMFLTEYWGALFGGQGAYRPILMLGLAIDYAFFGARPAGYHIVNVGLHAACVLVMYALARRYGVAWGIAAAATAVFAVHPVHTEAVANVVGRGEVLGALFFGLAWLGWKAWRERGGHLRYIAGQLAFLAALFTKENTVLLIPILAAVELAPTLDRFTTVERIFRTLRPFAGFLLTLGIYLAFRAATGQLAPVRGMSQLAGLSAWGKFSTVAAMSLEWPRLLVVGYPLKPWYDRFNLPFTDHATWRTWVGVAWLAAAAAWLAWLRRRHPVAAFALFFLFVTVAAVSLFSLAVSAVLAERWLYLGTAGYAILVAWLIEQGCRRKSSLVRIAALALLGSLLAWYATVTVSRNPDWRDNATLFQRFVETDPGHPLGYSQLGAESVRRGDPIRARLYFDLALERNPASFEASLGMAQLDVSENRQAAARARLSAMAAARPPDLPTPDDGWARVHALYAEVLARAGESDTALEQFQTAVKTSPASPLMWTQLGDAYLTRGDTDAALTAYDRAIALDPDFLQAHNNRGVLLMRTGRTVEAEREFETVLRLNPDSSNARRNLDLLRQRRPATGTP